MPSTVLTAWGIYTVGSGRRKCISFRQLIEQILHEGVAVDVIDIADRVAARIEAVMMVVLWDGAGRQAVL